MLARQRGRRRRRHAPVSVSDLECPEDRFLALAVDRVIAEGFRSPDDFVRYFSPARIGRAIAVSPTLRRRVLGVVAGYTATKAAQQTVQQTGVVVDRAFVDGDASPEILLQLLTADDCVRYLDPNLLWHFVADHHEWQRRPKDALPRRRTVASLLTAAIDEGLISQTDVFSRIGPARLALWLPPAQLAKLVELALVQGSANRSADADDLARTVSLAALSRAVPPHELLDDVLLPLLHPRMIATRARPVVEGAIVVTDERAVPPPLPGTRIGYDGRWRRGWDTPQRRE